MPYHIFHHILSRLIFSISGDKRDRIALFQEIERRLDLFGRKVKFASHGIGTDRN